MSKLLSLKVGGVEITAPQDVPKGGLDKGQTIIQNSITLLLTATAIFSIVMLIWGGMMWVTSNGDKAKIDSARKRVIYSIIGLVVAFLSFTILSFIEFLFGVKMLGFSA